MHRIRAAPTVQPVYALFTYIIMLSRAVLLLARPLILSSSLRSSFRGTSSLSAQHTRRWYAKNNKPKRPYELPDFAEWPKQPPKSVPRQQQDQEDKPTDSNHTDEPSPANEPNSTSESNPANEQETQKPLPDLTQGIPSTLEAELEANRPKKRPLNLTEDPSQFSDGYGGELGGSGGGGGDVSRGGYVSSADRRRRLWANVSYVIFLLSGVGLVTYLGHDWDTKEEADEHPDAPSGFGLKLFYNRAKARVGDLSSYYKDPVFPKLLPDEDPQLRQPYTLVISLEDLLVHSEWSREHGWRLAKRPGVDYFLRYLNQYYELVLFTSVPSAIADQVLRKLDPYRIIRWPLFREATKYEKGKYIKVCS